tara:strand:- start:102 stop:344 length:243 start_codon:yes stop_codon:yes gene_type:complete
MYKTMKEAPSPNLHVDDHDPHGSEAHPSKQYGAALWLPKRVWFDEVTNLHQSWQDDGSLRNATEKHSPDFHWPVPEDQSR